ncbi:hypothetical protein M0R45_010248 [Rubus argutus]|uniref:Nucleosome assembly protein n=1 Tax=Rubus argutus TaxID=59490 RepID=A0AAW1Y7E9_RUBAR
MAPNLGRGDKAHPRNKQREHESLSGKIDPKRKVSRGRPSELDDKINKSKKKNDQKGIKNRSEKKQELDPKSSPFLCQIETSRLVEENVPESIDKPKTEQPRTAYEVKVHQIQQLLGELLVDLKDETNFNSEKNKKIEKLIKIRSLIDDYQIGDDASWSIGHAVEDHDILVDNLKASFLISIHSRIPDSTQSTNGHYSDTLEISNVYKRIEALKALQRQHTEVEKVYLEERAQLKDNFEYSEYQEARDKLEAIYQDLVQPFYRERYEIVNGVTEVGGIDSTTTEEKGVPDFWLTAMKNNELLADEITKRDEEALKYLKDITWSRATTCWGRGFDLKFFFRPNPFFEDSVLTKSYWHPIRKTTGWRIKWRDDECLTQKRLKRPPTYRKPIVKTIKSFFNFFNPPRSPHPTKEELFYDGEVIIEEFEGHMKYDYCIGKTIRDKIIPHAVSWFTGDALQKGHDFEDLVHDYDDDRYSDLSDDQEELDEEEEEEKRKSEEDDEDDV